MVGAAHQIHLIGIDRLRRVSASAQWDSTAHRITSGWPVNHRDRSTSTSSATIRTERKTHLHEALNSLDPIDREFLVLRHFEELSNGEAAAVLGLDKSVPRACCRTFPSTYLGLSDCSVTPWALYCWQ